MNLKTGSLTPQLLRIIRDKSTEYPFTGEYMTMHKQGPTCVVSGISIVPLTNQIPFGLWVPQFR